MADLFKEAQENVKQHTDSAEAEVERNAQELFGGVAESQEEWQHQKDLGNRARSRERSYEEASKSLTEAIATTFSEALGTLVPEAGELTKEWMKDLLDEAIIPSLEHRIEGQALSVLKWSEQNFTVGLSSSDRRSFSVSTFPEKAAGNRCLPFWQRKSTT